LLRTSSSAIQTIEIRLGLAHTPWGTVEQKVATKRKQFPHIASSERVCCSFKDCYGITERQSDCLVVVADAKVCICGETPENGATLGIRFWDDIAYSLKKQVTEDWQSTEPMEGDPFLRL
jgi:hypothetical protein